MGENLLVINSSFYNIVLIPFVFQSEKTMFLQRAWEWMIL